MLRHRLYDTYARDGQAIVCHLVLGVCCYRLYDMHHRTEQAVGFSLLYYRQTRRACNSGDAVVVGKHYHNSVGKQSPQKEVISLGVTKLGVQVQQLQRFV